MDIKGRLRHNFNKGDLKELNQIGIIRMLDALFGALPCQVL